VEVKAEGVGTGWSRGVTGGVGARKTLVKGGAGEEEREKMGGQRERGDGGSKGITRCENLCSGSDVEWFLFFGLPFAPSSRRSPAAPSALPAGLLSSNRSNCIECREWKSRNKGGATSVDRCGLLLASHLP